MKDERLALTLERVAADPDTFYTGDLADDIGKKISHLMASLSLYFKHFNLSGRFETSEFNYHERRFGKIRRYDYRNFDLKWPRSTWNDLLWSKGQLSTKAVKRNKNRCIQHLTEKIFISRQRHQVAQFYNSCSICWTKLNSKDWTKGF